MTYQTCIYVLISSVHILHPLYPLNPKFILDRVCGLLKLLSSQPSSFFHNLISLKIYNSILKYCLCSCLLFEYTKMSSINTITKSIQNYTHSSLTTQSYTYPSSLYHTLSSLTTQSYTYISSYLEKYTLFLGQTTIWP